VATASTGYVDMSDSKIFRGTARSSLLASNHATVNRHAGRPQAIMFHTFRCTQLMFSIDS
jgi:hypothetical protein